MNKIKTTAAALALIFVMTGNAQARTIRATELSTTALAEIMMGKPGDLIIEFRQGDQLPVTLRAEGDLIETTQSAVSYVGVKRNFWIREQKSAMQISFDGNNYKDVQEVLTGSFSAGSGMNQNGGVASALSILFQAYLK